MPKNIQVMQGTILTLFCLWFAWVPAHAGGRYVNNGNGTVTDRTTGLIALKNANCFGKRTWKKAVSVVQRLASGSCGLSDGSRPGSWRLPTKKELSTLFFWSGSGAFRKVRPHIYWSRTSFGAPKAWYIHLNLGDVGVTHKSNRYYVWPVRNAR